MKVTPVTRLLFVWGLSAAALAVGCAGKLPACPSRGGPAWRELESPHFRLRTDTDPDEARTTLVELEQFQAALLTVFGAPLDLRTGRLPVVLLRDGWFMVADGTTEAIFTHALFQPLLVKRAGGDLLRQTVVKHELCHHLHALVMPAHPRWLAEGLASYFETMEYDAEKGQLTIGRPPPALLGGVHGTTFLHVQDTLEADGRGGDRFVSYAAAWAIVHYLMNHRRAQFVEYQQALIARTSFAEAWKRAFGALTPAALEVEIRGYLDSGQYAMLLLPFSAPREVPIAERTLSDADAHAMRALLAFAGRLYRAGAPGFVGSPAELTARARAELDEVFRQEPGHVEGRALAHWGLGAPVDLAQAQQATRDRPGDWLAWLLYAEALRARKMEGAALAIQTAVQIARVDPNVVIPVDAGAPGRQGP